MLFPLAFLGIALYTLYRGAKTPVSATDIAVIGMLRQESAWSKVLSRDIPESSFDYAEAASIYFSRDSIDWAIEYLKTKPSLCAVYCKALLREGGCKCREHGPYERRVGKAVADIETIARRHGAWRNTPSDTGAFPNNADIVVVAQRLPPYNEHVLMVLASSPASSLVISADSGNPNIRVATRERRLIAPASGASPYLEDTDDGVSTRVGYQRPIYGRVDTRAVLSTLNLCSLGTPIMISARIASIATHVDENTFEVELDTHPLHERFTFGPFPRALAYPTAIACLAAYHADPNTSISLPFLGGFALRGLDDAGSILLALNPERIASEGLAGLLSSLALGTP